MYMHVSVSAGMPVRQRHTGPCQELDSSEDNMVSSDIPELDSEHEERDTCT